MVHDLKKFLLRGNLIDLAVAVIIGIAFGAVVLSLVNDVIMPVIGAVFGKPNFNDLTFHLGDGVVAYGKFITAAVNFVIIATVLFLVVRAADELFAREKNRPRSTSSPRSGTSSGAGRKGPRTSVRSDSRPGKLTSWRMQSRSGGLESTTSRTSTSSCPGTA